MNSKEFGAWVVMVIKAWPQLPLNDPQVMDMWFEALQDLTIEQLNSATKMHMQNSPYPPKVYDLRYHATNMIQGNLEDWGEAWEEVARAIKKYGSYREGEALASMSPMAARAAKAIGFKAICMSENPETTRAQFRDIFNSFSHREEQNRHFSPDIQQMLADANVKLLK